MRDSIRKYFNDEDFRYTVFLDKIHIINFNKIVTVDDDKVIIIYKNKTIEFIGNGFILNKLLNNEVIINGKLLGVKVYEV